MSHAAITFIEGTLPPWRGNVPVLPAWLDTFDPTNPRNGPCTVPGCPVCETHTELRRSSPYEHETTG